MGSRFQLQIVIYCYINHIRISYIPIYVSKIYDKTPKQNEISELSAPISISNFKIS
jgi:hypothetical protein